MRFSIDAKWARAALHELDRFVCQVTCGPLPTGIDIIFVQEP
jgi:hypothetical protein